MDLEFGIALIGFGIKYILMAVAAGMGICLGRVFWKRKKGKENFGEDK